MLCGPTLLAIVTNGRRECNASGQAGVGFASRNININPEKGR